jgi:hypothetical protein
MRRKVNISTLMVFVTKEEEETESPKYEPKIN